MIKTCPICGDEFEGNSRKTYCTPLCYRKNKAQHNIVRNRQLRARARRTQQIELWVKVTDRVHHGASIQELMDTYYIRKR